jgi:hypothetical protein
MVPDGEGILVIGESRRLHMPDGAVMSDWFDPPAVNQYLNLASTPEDLSAALRAAGITHVLVNFEELFPPWMMSQALQREGGTPDAAGFWRAWRDRAPFIPPASNLAYFRHRFSDEQAALLADWFATVPHETIWPQQPITRRGVELWRLEAPEATAP